MDDSDRLDYNAIQIQYGTACGVYALCKQGGFFEVAHAPYCKYVRMYTWSDALKHTLQTNISRIQSMSQLILIYEYSSLQFNVKGLKLL